MKIFLLLILFIIIMYIKTGTIKEDNIIKNFIFKISMIIVLSFTFLLGIIIFITS